MELKPEPASLSSQARPLSGNGEVLAGEASANKVNCCNCIPSDISHILYARHAGPVRSQHRPRCIVNLALPSALHPGLLEAKVKAADTTK